MERELPDDVWRHIKTFFICNPHQYDFETARCDVCHYKCKHLEKINFHFDPQYEGGECELILTCDKCKCDIFCEVNGHNAMERRSYILRNINNSLIPETSPIFDHEYEDQAALCAEDIRLLFSDRSKYLDRFDKMLRHLYESYDYESDSIYTTDSESE